MSSLLSELSKGLGALRWGMPPDAVTAAFPQAVPIDRQLVKLPDAEDVSEVEPGAPLPGLPSGFPTVLISQFGAIDPEGRCQLSALLCFQPDLEEIRLGPATREERETQEAPEGSPEEAIEAEFEDAQALRRTVEQLLLELGLEGEPFEEEPTEQVQTRQWTVQGVKVTVHWDSWLQAVFVFSVKP